MSVAAADDDAAEIAALRLSLLRAEALLAAMREALRSRAAGPPPTPGPPGPPTEVVPAEPAPSPIDAAALHGRIQRQQAEIEQLRLHVASYQASAVWRATWPLRRLLDRFPGPARAGRRALRICWWGLTLQGPARLRARAAHRRVAEAVPAADGEVVAEPVATPGPGGAPDQPVTAPPVADDVVVLPTSEAPVVSIVVPAFGQVPATLRCLRAIAASATTTPYEVIVADDASDDPELPRLAAVRGLRLVRNPRNLGYLLNCNAAARLARGHYLLFLNNDTEPLPGFLDALVRLAQARPDAGLVGSRLLFPDGRLQEAGGIVWQDGTGWNYGRGDDPTLPQYNTVRDADYVSGASILLRRALFEALQGFDPAFAPAYYEDTDLAFRIRARGLRVLLQPASTVVHHEGLSHGTDIGSGIKARQEVNRHVMLARWPKLLATEHLPVGVQPMRAREHARGRPTILVIDHYVPEPDRDAGSRCTLGLLAALRDAGWVVSFWPQNRAHNDYTHLLETIGVTVLDSRLPIGFPGWIAGHGAELDHVLVMRPTVAVEFVSDLLRHTGARLSFFGHDVHHLRMRRQAELTGDGAGLAEAAAMERLERRLWGLFDVSLYLSEAEAALVRRLVPGAQARVVVPYGYDRFPARTAPPAGHTILFVAGFAHPPNVDAATWLVGEILPLVRRMLPDVRLVLAGSHPTEAVRALAGDGIEVTGSLGTAALLARYAGARAAIVPLRAGAGVKGKVVEALQQGLPLVTTRIGAEGLPGLETLVPVADDPVELADALAALLQDDRLWMRQAAVQLAYAERHFSRAALSSSVLAALA